MTELLHQLQAALADHYALERELGRGGMATVYLARDLKHRRQVALKVLHPELAYAVGAARFLREIEVAANLSHPHILPLFDSGEAQGLLYYVMPYVDGESLRDRLTRERQLPIEEALRITREVGDALAYAHKHGVVHRDIKPENILLTESHALVADFGIARAVSQAGGERLTETGLAVGTAAYMSPEQATGERELDGRTDLYSLACVLYEMLAGEPPHAGPTAQAILARAMTEPPRPIHSIRAGVPDALDAAIRRAMAVAPADRFPGVAPFVAAVEATPSPGSGGMPAQITATPTEKAANKRRLAPLLDRLAARPLFTVLVLGALIGAGVLFAWRGRHSEGQNGNVKRLAVLPFENLGDSADAYFADGITDAVRGKLSGLPGLQVTARSSTNQYRNSTKTPQQIGQELGAEFLLTGTIRWEKAAGGTSRVQVTPELVLAAAGSTKWQRPFAAALTDVFEVQAEIATQVAQALNVALGDSAQQHLPRAPTENLAAYDAFLRGEAAAQGMSVTDRPSLRRAEAAYEQAIALDSTFFEAWAQLARTRAILYYLSRPTPVLAEAARAAASRALKLAPARPEGHRAMSAYYANVLGDIDRALHEDSTALLLGPVDADLLVALARKEMAFGRWDTALAHLQHASRLDPRSAVTASRLGFALLWLRKYPEARQAYDHALALAPTNLALYGNKAFVLLALGDLAGAREVVAVAAKETDHSRIVAYFGDGLSWLLDDRQQAELLGLAPSAFDEDRGSWGIVLAEAHWLKGDHATARAYADSARIALEEQVHEVPNDADLRGSLGQALAYLGRKADAIREGERSVALAPAGTDAVKRAGLENDLVQIYALVGESEKALDHLEPLLTLPSPLSPARLRIDPTFVPLRGNPRFERLANGPIH
jgi:serine/threonine-protein kinase